MSLLKIKLKFWECALVATEWLFGYNHQVSHEVKHKRNMAYFAYVFHKPEKESK